MLFFAGTAYTKAGDHIQFEIKATSEAEAKKELREKLHVQRRSSRVPEDLRTA